MTQIDSTKLKEMIKQEIAVLEKEQDSAKDHIEYGLVSGKILGLKIAQDTICKVELTALDELIKTYKT